MLFYLPLSSESIPQILTASNSTRLSGVVPCICRWARCRCGASRCSVSSRRSSASRARWSRYRYISVHRYIGSLDRHLGQLRRTRACSASIFPSRAANSSRTQFFIDSSDISLPMGSAIRISANVGPVTNTSRKMAATTGSSIAFCILRCAAPEGYMAAPEAPVGRLYCI